MYIPPPFYYIHLFLLTLPPINVRLLDFKIYRPPPFKLASFENKKTLYIVISLISYIYIAPPFY